MTQPSVRERLGRGPSAFEVLLARRDEPHPVALVGSWAAGTAVLGAAPVRTAVGAAAAWAALDEPHVVGPGDAQVGGGWIGTLGYGLGASVERLGPPPPRPVPSPAAWLGYYDHLLLLDADGVWWFEALPGSAARAAQLRDRLAALSSRVFSRDTDSPAHGRSNRVSRDVRLVDAHVRAPGYAGHAAAVAAGVEAIRAGEVFQANLCLRVDARLEGAPIDLFARAAAATQPAFGAYVDTGARQLLSLSPERFLRRERATVIASPIKGTAPRDADPAALRASGKDRAEHVMILDLMRNDLGRVCEFGSVKADPEPRVEPHPGVWHLVSDVRGTLRPGVTDTDVLRATFPSGSVTGAPKVQALHVIGRLEATGREAYTGAIGLVSPLAGLELNVAIRTFEIAGDRVWLGAGGGIVADSDPAAETAEAWRKAAPLLRAAGADLDPPPPAAQHDGARAAAASSTGAAPAAGGPPAPRPNLPAPARGFRRPDPALGVLETIGIGADGVPRRLAAHLARLSRSVRTIYGAELDVAAARAAIATRTADARRTATRPGATAVAGAGGATAAGSAADSGGATAAGSAPDSQGARASGWRVRVRWTPPGRVDVEAADAGPVRDTAVELSPLVVPGGLGEHKWQDRTLVQDTPGALIVDLDGSVLEAGWATVWALEGDTLVTPPADGRILPGVTRAALLADPDVPTAEAPLDLDRLARADAIVLTASVTLAALGRLGAGRTTGREPVERLRARLSDPCG